MCIFVSIFPVIMQLKNADYEGMDFFVFMLMVF